jgi:hypothetical protein
MQIYDMKEPLLLEVKDHDVMGSSDPIGDVRLDISNIASAYTLSLFTPSLALHGPIRRCSFNRLPRSRLKSRDESE